MNEEWKTLDYLPPNIEVSSMGNVRKWVTKNEFIEVNQTVSGGYKSISVGGKQYSVHRMIADAFIPEEEGKTIVRHKDGNKFNNTLDNIIRAVRGTGKGSPVGARKLVHCIETDELFGSVRSAAVLTTIPQELVSLSIKEGESVCGHTFEHVSSKEHLDKMSKITYDDLVAIGKESTSIESFQELIKAAAHTD